MTLLFTNGFQHSIPAEAVGAAGFDALVAPARALYRNTADQRLSIRPGYDGDHNRGGQVFLDEPGPLFVGGRVWPDDLSNLSDRPCRFLLVYVNDVRVLQVCVNNTSSARSGTPSNGFAVYNGVDTASTLDAGNVLAASPADVFDDDTNLAWSLAITRGETEGTFDLKYEGASIAAGVSPDLAESEGPITQVTFTSRGPSTSGTSGSRLDHNDCWVDNERDWSGAKVGLIVPAADGFYTDGTVVGEANAWEAVNNSPPATDSYVELESGESASFEYGPIAPTEAGIAVGGIMVRPAETTDLPFEAFMREGGTDELLAELTPVSGALDYRTRAVVEVNPHTGQPFTLADIDGIEIGWKLP